MFVPTKLMNFKSGNSFTKARVPILPESVSMIFSNFFIFPSASKSSTFLHNWKDTFVRLFDNESSALQLTSFGALYNSNLVI